MTNSVDILRTASRILVLGCSGSGKTHLSVQLGKTTGLEVIHLDAWFWQPGWRPTPQEEWRRCVAELVRRKRWIMDGTYEASLDLRLRAADCIIILNSNRPACLWRVWRRIHSGTAADRTDAPPGQKLDLPYFRYIWNYPAATRREVNRLIRDHAPDTPRIELAGANACTRLLHSLQGLA